MDKIKEIENILETSRRTNLSISYALHSALTIEDFKYYIKKYYQNNSIRDELLKHIIQKLNNKGIEDLLDYFIDEYEKQTGKQKRGINKIFTELNGFLNIQQRKKIFDISIGSDKSSIRKKGYEQAYIIFNDFDLTMSLQENWNKYKDIEVLKIFIKNDEYDYIYNNFEILWNDPEINQSIKKQMANGLGKNRVEILPKIKNKNLITYMSACFYAKNLTFLGDLNDILNSSETIGELSYCIWILGQLGLYDKIIESLPIIEKIEVKLPKTYSEMQYEIMNGE